MPIILLQAMRHSCKILVLVVHAYSTSDSWQPTQLQHSSVIPIRQDDTTAWLPSYCASLQLLQQLLHALCVRKLLHHLLHV